MFNEDIVGITISLETYNVLQRCKRECELSLELANKLLDKYIDNGDENKIVTANNTVKHLEYILGLKTFTDDEKREMNKGRYFINSMSDI